MGEKHFQVAEDCEPLTPQQFNDAVHRPSERHPEARLLLAVLQGAIEDLLSSNFKLHIQARAWIAGYPAHISFATCCDALGLKVSWLRRALLRIAAGNASVVRLPGTRMPPSRSKVHTRMPPYELPLLSPGV
jgi:hypothetical protein